MKRWAYLTLIFLTSGKIAQAGFRHPIEQSGAEAIAIQNTPIQFAPSASAKRMMPDRAIESNSAPRPEKIGKASESKSKTPEKDIAHVPSKSLQVPQKNAVNFPLPKAPALPAAVRFGIPNIQLPHSTKGDGLLSMKPESLDLKGLNRTQIYNFIRKARALPEPKHDFTKEVRSRDIAERYREALHPTPYRSFRSPYRLSLAQIDKINTPPESFQYENLVKRIDSLFEGLDLNYPEAILGLWQLAESPSNPKKLQARDSLFAGLLSERANWETPAAMLLAESAEKGVEQEPRYLQILWSHLELLSNPAHIEKIVSKINAQRQRDLTLEGDKANFAMAKRMLFEKTNTPLLKNPSADSFAKKIHKKSLQEKLRLLSLLKQIQNPNQQAYSEAVMALRSLESEGSEEIQGEARLALARVILHNGDPREAMALYRNVQKNGKNRLEVLAEQTYAEYLSGEFQDSLGKAMGLQSPYFQFGFVPDIHLVEILSRKAMCDFGGAEAGVQRLSERYVPELKAIETKLAEKINPEDFYKELISYRDLERPMRFQRYLLQLTQVMENQKTMNQALADLERIDLLGVKQQTISRPEGWDLFASSMRKRWSLRATELRKISAENALAEAAYLSKRLRHTFAQLEILDLDISTAATKNYNLQNALNFPARKKLENQADREKLRWPFENEIWEDEIDFMRAKNPSKCAVTASI